MPDLIHQLGVYLHLAQASRRRGQPNDRDRFLLLAANLALRLALPDVAEYCRAQTLAHNRHHLVGHWPSFASAVQSEEFLAFMRTLEARFPLEKGESMLASLGIQMASERATYFSDLEYAAALLGVTPAGLADSTKRPD